MFHFTYKFDGELWVVDPFGYLMRFVPISHLFVQPPEQTFEQTFVQPPEQTLEQTFEQTLEQPPEQTPTVSVAKGPLILRNNELRKEQYEKHMDDYKRLCGKKQPEKLPEKLPEKPPEKVWKCQYGSACKKETCTGHPQGDKCPKGAFCKDLECELRHFDGNGWFMTQCPNGEECPYKDCWNMHPIEEGKRQQKIAEKRAVEKEEERQVYGRQSAEWKLNCALKHIDGVRTTNPKGLKKVVLNERHKLAQMGKFMTPELKERFEKAVG